MKKVITRILILLPLIFLFSWTALAQPWIIGVSNEWEATGFNNGVRIVRDSNGYFHAFWHSQPDMNAQPSGNRCDLYYTYTIRPASEPPSMAWQNAWVYPPLNLTAGLHNQDNRYPVAAIEYDYFGGAWRDCNRIHLVWQAVLPNGNRYEVVYANFKVTNPPTAPPAWTTVRNLSNTPLTDSLVPAIAINHYADVNYKHSLHVVWQEEDINGPVGNEDTPFSDIAYIYSPNSGSDWGGPGGGWGGHSWDNLTCSLTNSQLPSIACIPDQYTGTPGGRPDDLGYNSDDVHVSYHENVGPNNINVFYLRSPNNGVNWDPRINVSTIAGGTDSDAYSCIAVDQLDCPHIVFMRHQMIQREPLRTTTGTNYLAGYKPNAWWAFPGPEVGMYSVYSNQIVYAYYNGGVWTSHTWGVIPRDQEFPTVSLDRWQHVNVNWQEYDQVTHDYEIMRDTNINLSPPNFPLWIPLYQGWSGPVSDSASSYSDDIFPNLAYKKTAVYKSPDAPRVAGFDAIWTMVNGHGPDAATSSVKTVMQDGNVGYSFP